MSNSLKIVWATAVALIAGVVIGITMFGKPSAGTASHGAAGKERIIMITHGQAADPYWNIVKNGAEQASRQLGVTLDYRAPETFDMIRMGELITSAANQRPDGIIVSIPDASALRDPIRSAVRAGIPIVSINSGSDVSAGLGALIHVGQDEYETGKRVGERLRTEGARKVICINQEVGNTALDARCRGVLDGSGANGFVLPTSIDPQEVKSKIVAALAGDPGIDAVVALSAPQVGEPAVEAVRAARRPVKVASFDMSPAFLQAIGRGEALFAIDQQAYLQGYLSTVLLTNRIRYGLMPANRLIESGPNFVTRAEAANVLTLSQRSIR